MEDTDMDEISLFLNTFFYHIFTLKTVSYMGFQMYQIGDKTTFYHLHYVFAYALIYFLYLQPQMTSEGKMLGAEALVRWQHPKRGLIFPGDFIEIFERTGLIYRLDRYVWKLAVRKLAQWQKEGHDELYISVNISTKDFYYMDVYQTITSLVEKYGIIPSTLKLEITETALMMGTAGELDIIGQFRKYGFEVETEEQVSRLSQMGCGIYQV